MPDLSRLDRRMRDLLPPFEFRSDGPEGRGFETRGGPGRGRLGVELMRMTPQLATAFGVKAGVMVATVDADSPAGRAGLKAGDIITAVGGRSVDHPEDVRQEIRRAGDGATVSLTVTRDRKEMTLTATMPERQRSRGERRGRSI
jgi:serine protease Do